MEGKKEPAGYRLVRSKRKTLALEVRDGEVIVRAPYRVSISEIDAFVISHEGWIQKQVEKQREKKEALSDVKKLTPEELQALADEAAKVIPGRVRYYAEKIGVTYGRITIRAQKTRWGSCSSKGNLNFNCLLMLMPKEVLDAVVVHELCHRKEMNHSGRFYEEVYRVYPDYDKWNSYLKENGARALAMLP